MSNVPARPERPMAELEADLAEKVVGVAERLHAAVQLALSAGDDLIEAKARLAHGEWLPWLQEHFPLGERTAQKWMLLARNPNRGRISEAGSIREALALIAPPLELAPAEPRFARTIEAARRLESTEKEFRVALLDLVEAEGLTPEEEADRADFLEYLRDDLVDVEAVLAFARDERTVARAQERLAEEGDTLTIPATLDEAVETLRVNAEERDAALRQMAAKAAALLARADLTPTTEAYAYDLLDRVRQERDLDRS